MIPTDPALTCSGPAPVGAPAPTEPPAAARALIEEQLAMLTRLARIGMEIAEAVGREATAPGAAAPDAAPHDAAPQNAGARTPAAPAHHGPVFARVARAVRMTIALQARLMKELTALDRAEAHAAHMSMIGRRARLRGLVDEAARTLVEARRKAEGRYLGEEDAAEAEIELMTEAAYERLTDAEEEELDRLSFDEAVAGVCRDLGLAPDQAARLMASVEPPPAAPPPLPLRHPPAAPGRGQGPTRGQAPRSGGRWRRDVGFGHPPLDRPDKPDDDDVGDEAHAPP